MKTRLGFVSNSSSTSFIIYNNTKKEKSVADFALENTDLVKRFNEEYSDDVTIGELVFSAEKDYSDKVLIPGKNTCVFGDEQGTVLGRVYDYILRDGGSSESFSWHFDDYLR